MIVLIPVGGKGLRFKKTHSQPKALINVMGKEIIKYLLDNLNNFSVFCNNLV